MVAGSLMQFLPATAGYGTPDGRLSIGMGMVIVVVSLIALRARSRVPAVAVAGIGTLALVAATVDLLGARPGPGAGLLVVAAGSLLAASAGAGLAWRGPAGARHAGEGAR